MANNLIEKENTIYITTLFKALSDTNRVRIVEALYKHEELCACQITDLVRVTNATVSRHMEILIQSGFVESRKDGRWVFYRLKKECPAHNDLIEWANKYIHKEPVILNDEKALQDILKKLPKVSCKVGNERKN